VIHSGLLLALAVLSGCVVAERPRSSRQPVTVIETAPPPPRREVVVVRPSARHVWIAGYWAGRDGRHVWVPGHWVLPPRERAVWVEPRWEHRGNGYVFIEGSWR